MNNVVYIGTKEPQVMRNLGSVLIYLPDRKPVRKYLIRAVLVTALLVGFVTFQATRWHVQAQYQADGAKALALVVKK